MVIRDTKTDTLQDRLDRVILNAMNITERIAHIDKSKLSNATSSNQKALDEWSGMLGCKNESQFNEWLELMGWEKEDLSNVLSNAASYYQPDLNWSKDIQKTFSNLEKYCGMIPSESSNTKKNKIHNIILPFIKMAEAFVIAKSDEIGLKITYTSGAKIVSIFSNRMISLCLSILDSEIYLSSILNAFGGDNDDDLRSMESWLSRIERYPVLGRMVATTYSNWEIMIAEFMQRLYDDQGFISDYFFDGEPLGFLVDFSGDAGDVHCGGRSVALLTFSGGKRLVYKPKNLELANNYFQLIDYLNPFLSLELASRKITIRGEYTWEEFITFKECSSELEFPLFYKRLGMHTRILQLLGARDFWLDNLIAHGDQPSFIDLEMIIQHIKDEGADLLPSEKKALSQLEETISMIGIVSFPTPIGVGVKAEDLGVLAPIKPFSSPFKMDLSSGNKMGIELDKSENGFIVWDKDDYVPCVDGKFANPEFYMDYFLAGYEEMNAVLVNKKKALLQSDSCIFNLKKSLLRYIHRDTWTYMRIIKSTSHSQSLVNGLVKDKALFSLFREVWIDNKLNVNKAKVLKDEIEHLADLDVPLFNSEGGSSNLLVDDYEIEDYFIYNALEKIIERLENIDSFDLDFHKDIILSSFATGNHNPPPRKKIDPAIFVNVDESNIDWGAYAKSCADFIASKAINDQSDDLAWIGLDFQSYIDNYFLEVLKPDILSGTCGLGMLFADIFDAFKDTKYKALSIGSLQSTLNIVAHSRANFSMLEHIWDTSDKPLHLGAYLGIGSQILALEYCANRLNSKELENALHAYIDAIPLEAIREYTTNDFMTGYAGLLFSLPKNVINKRGAELLNFEFTKPIGLPLNSELLNRLPSFNNGVEYYNSLEGIVSSEIKKPTNIGGYFALLEHTDTTAQRNEVERIVKVKLEDEVEGLTVFELLENADLALCMFDLFSNSWYMKRAKLYAAEIVRRHKVSGKWFGDVWGADAQNLSVVFGIGALSHLFLRIHKPGIYGSFRKLKTFKNQNI